MSALSGSTSGPPRGPDRKPLGRVASSARGTSTGRVALVAVRESGSRQAVLQILRSWGCEIVEAPHAESVLHHVETTGLDLVVLGASLETPRDGLDAVPEIRHRNRRVPVILVVADGSEELAVAALRAGVDDYFNQAARPDDMAAGMSRCLARSSPPLGSQVNGSATTDLAGAQRLIGPSRAMCQVRTHIARLALADCTVLVTGETGTGKELVAELIHTNSRRAAKPLLCLNCAALPEGLVESELFGYERGAFTGAHAAYAGKLGLANGGTVLLDEIGDMSAPAQAKILRLVERKEAHPLGGRPGRPLDVRVIAATNQNLETLIGEGRFRRDLYFRLNVARVHLPPLRERREDIPFLVAYYVQQLNRMGRTEVEGLTEDALARLLDYDWPGNVRELRNVLEAVFVAPPARWIAACDLPAAFQDAQDGAAETAGSELDRLLLALTASGWNKSRAARKLRWSRMTLYRKLVKYHLPASRP
jgi:DNA-binding NtrC family response regulator